MTETIERDEIDSIERSIDIDASAERVWQLISVPGWFINSGTVIDHEIRQEDGYVVVIDPKHGEFPLRTVRLDPPRYAAFRWFTIPGADASQEHSTSATLVEFWITERDGGVTLRVLESGFASLPIDAEKRRIAVDQNTEGWELELAAARSFLSDAGTA
ncbi:MAG TPA: SRPBCC domain-containing protein [Microterricola sp.]